MVMLPGLDGTGRLFMPQVAALSEYFDLRCLSIPADNRQDWEDLAGTVIHLIQRQQQRRETYICGESYGGCLALKIALTAPKLMNRLVLINPASSLRRQTWLRWVSQAADYVPDWLYNTSGAMVLPLLANFDRIHSHWQQAFVDTVRPIPRDCVNWRLSMLQRFEAPAEQLRQVMVQTALFSSGRDRLLPSRDEVARLRHSLPQAVTYDLPESGHVCLLERDINLAKCLKKLDFLPMLSSVEV